MRAAGDTFDELTAFGEQIDRKDRSATAVEDFAELYGRYARGRVGELAAALLEAHAERRRRALEARRISAELESAAAALEETDGEKRRNDTETTRTRGRLSELRAGPEARSEQRLLDLDQLVTDRRRVAERAAEVAAAARERAERGRSACAALAATLSARLETERDRWSQTSRLMTRTGWSRGVAVGETGIVRDRESAKSTLRVMESVEAVVVAERSALGAMRAAVEVVDQARREHEAARVEADRAGELAAEADRRLDDAIGREERGRRDAEALAAQLSADLRAWATDAPGLEVVVPQPTTHELAELPAFARRVSAAARAEWSERLAGQRAKLKLLMAEGLDLKAQRQFVADQTDPLPPTPNWTRDSRERLAGAPFWRLVDFTAGTSPEVRAAVEAALEASGLLDAWVMPDGAVLAPGRHDVVLAAGAPSSGASVAAVLTPDEPPAGSGWLVTLVTGLLARIGWQGAGETAVASDGRWWLGGLHGRAAKATAQYIGAGAREAERARRLAEIDDRLARIVDETVQVEAARVAAAAAVQTIDDWVDAVPAHAAMLEAWARLDVLEDATREARELQTDAQQLAEQARARAAAAGAALRGLAGTHDLPADADGLATRRAMLSELEQALAEHVRVADGLLSDLSRWLEDDERTTTEESDHIRRQEQLDTAQTELDDAAARLVETERTVGADVAELRRRISVLEGELQLLGAAAGELGRLHDEQVATLGGLRSRLASAEEREAETQPPLAEAARAFASGALVPGVLEAVLGSDIDPSKRHAVSTATAALDGTHPTVPREAIAEARNLANVGDHRTSVNELLAGWRELQAGAGADVEPRLVEREGVYLVTGRDDRGEQPLSVLAPRLRAAVENDKGLLSERERRLFEEHLLGSLGHALRDRRREADDLVRAMNQLLEGVSTSQGIRVRLQWKLRDDIPADARRAVELLGERIEALLPDERRDLSDALHRLIEASRAEAPEDSYTEHLAKALDYRQWFAFRIRYSRPEGGGTWHELQRRSPLSQGEQKVVCYLPLFAAAAAHFTSLAGAAPHSPRIIMLDDAFPKIDAPTHPLLFGLLVDLDLDFVITSERLWGDHDTVPSLAIYEALRDPAQRGIAQFHHRWDGRRLQAVGS